MYRSCWAKAMMQHSQRPPTATWTLRYWIERYVLVVSLMGLVTTLLGCAGMHTLGIAEEKPLNDAENAPDHEPWPWLCSEGAKRPTEIAWEQEIDNTSREVTHVKMRNGVAVVLFDKKEYCDLDEFQRRFVRLHEHAHVRLGDLGQSGFDSFENYLDRAQKKVYAHPNAEFAADCYAVRTLREEVFQHQASLRELFAKLRRSDSQKHPAADERWTRMVGCYEASRPTVGEGDRECLQLLGGKLDYIAGSRISYDLYYKNRCDVVVHCTIPVATAWSGIGSDRVQSFAAQNHYITFEEGQIRSAAGVLYYYRSPGVRAGLAAAGAPNTDLSATCKRVR
jgi:hypothetical protein